MGVKLGLTFRKGNKVKVYENRVLRISGPKRVEMVGGWRKLHTDEIHDIITAIRSRRMGWTRHVAHVGMSYAYQF
jgi:hypothetical protein